MPMSPRLLRPRAAGGFSPRSISGLQIWYDGKDATTFLNSVSPDTQAASGQTVRQWRDKSGNARHADQPTAANQPTLASGGVLQFNGTNSFMDITGGLSVTRNIGYIAMFGAYAWRTGPGASQIIITFSTNAGHAFVRSVIGGGAVAQKYRTAGRRLDADGAANLNSSGDVVTNQTIVHTGIINYAAASASQRVSGTVLNSSSSFLTAGNASDTDSLAATIGAARNDATTLFTATHCDLREILVYTGTALTASQVSTIERYLAARWGVTLA